jgi:thioredoxin 1
LATRLPRLVDVGSKGCIPCKLMAPILDDLSKTYKGKLTVEFIDVAVDREAAQKYGVRVIPTQILYDKTGQELFRHVGVYPKEDILAEFKKHGIDLGEGSKHD